MPQLHLYLYSLRGRATRVIKHHQILFLLFKIVPGIYEDREFNDQISRLYMDKINHVS